MVNISSKRRYTVLHKSGYGCSVGDVYVGCIAYADDILILTASLFSLNKIIKICEQYATNYHAKFNGKKSRLIMFQKKWILLQSECLC